MKKDVQVVVIDKGERLKSGVVRCFNGIKNKVGTYKIDKVKNFSKKIEIFVIKFGTRVFYASIDLSEKIDNAFDKMLDKAFDYYDRMQAKREDTLQEPENIAFHEQKRIILPEEKNSGFSFDKLKPLASDMDDVVENDDITELKEFKKELLMANFDSYSSSEVNNSRRGSR